MIASDNRFHFVYIIVLLLFYLFIYLFIEGGQARGFITAYRISF